MANNWLIQRTTENWWKYQIERNWEVYFVAEKVWSPNQYTQWRDLSSSWLTIWKKWSEDTIHAECPFVQDLNLQIQNIDNSIQKAKLNFEEQERTQQQVRQIDLPKDKKIWYISLFPQWAMQDEMFSNMLDDSKNFSLLMRSKWYQFEDSPMYETQNPTNAINELIQERVDLWIKDIYLDLNWHWLWDKSWKEWMYFWKDHSNPLSILKWDQLVSILRNFPNVNFTINSIACHWWWFKNDFENAKLPNANLILQSQPEERNEEIRISWSQRADTTYFNVFYQQGISFMWDWKEYDIWEWKTMQIQTLWDCIYYADRKTWQYIQSNAQVIQKNQYIT